MSRQSFDNPNLQFVAGFDHATGAFIQLWQQPADDQDQPLLIVDKLGVRTLGVLPVNLDTYIATLDAEFQAFKTQHGEYPNLDEQRAINIAKKAGFTNPEVAKAIYQLWD